MEKKRVWFPVFRFVVPSDFEGFMEKMAGEGWQVGRIKQFNSFAMIFQKKEPKQYRYVFDLNAFPNLEYMDTYREFGWEFVGQMASCMIWRKEYDGIRPEAFSDRESLLRRNKRVINAVTACLFLFLAGILLLAGAIAICLWYGKLENCIGFGLEIILLALFSSYFRWVIVKIRRSQDE